MILKWMKLNHISILDSADNKIRIFICTQDILQQLNGIDLNLINEICEMESFQLHNQFI